MSASFALNDALREDAQRILRGLQGLVGFRNVLVHEYQKVDIALMVDVIENRLPDLLALVDAVIFEFNRISKEN